MLVCYFCFLFFWDLYLFLLILDLSWVRSKMLKWLMKSLFLFFKKFVLFFIWIMIIVLIFSIFFSILIILMIMRFVIWKWWILIFSLWLWRYFILEGCIILSLSLNLLIGLNVVLSLLIWFIKLGLVLVLRFLWKRMVRMRRGLWWGSICFFDYLIGLFFWWCCFIILILW